LAGNLCLAAGIFMEREEDEWARQEVIERWQNAGRSILSSVRMVRNAETLGDKFATGAERYLHTRIVLQQHCTCSGISIFDRPCHWFAQQTS